MSDEDYRALVGPLRRDAAGALQALERDSGPTREGSPQHPEARVESEEHEEHADAGADEGLAYEEHVAAIEEGRPAAERTS